MKTITQEQYDNLRDCEYSDNFGEWRKAKFYSRGKVYINVVVTSLDGTHFVSAKPFICVKVDGRQLMYIRCLTNPKNPF